MQNYIKSLVPLFITKLRQHLMIFSFSWIKKYGVLLDMIYDFIKFFSRFYTYLETFLSLISPKPIEKTKKIFKGK